MTMNSKRLVKRLALLAVLLLLIAPVFAVDLEQETNPKIDAALGQHKDNKPDVTDLTKTLANGGGEGGLAYPMDVALNPLTRQLFVADSQNGRVLVYDLDGADVQLDQIPEKVIGKNDLASPRLLEPTKSNLVEPLALAIDVLGNRLFVADSIARRILIFDISTISNGEDAIRVLGQPDFVSDENHGVTDSSLGSNITGMDYDFPTNRLFVCDSENHRVLIYDVSAITNNEPAIHVLGQQDFVSNDSGNASNQLYAPIDCALGIAGSSLFVSDSNNNRVLRYNLSDGIVDGEAANLVLGQPDFDTTLLGTSSSKMRFPGGLAVDQIANRLLVSDRGNNRLLIFEATNPGNGEDAQFVLGQADFDSREPATSINRLHSPSGITLDSAARCIWIADTTNNRLLRHSIAAPASFQPATNVLGQNGLVENFATNGLNGFDLRGIFAPAGVTMDTVRHRLFISDLGNRRVICHFLNAANEIMDLVPDAVLGHPDLETWKSPVVEFGENPTDDTFTFPMDVEIDEANGRLFVVDANNRVLVFDVHALTSGEAAIHVLGRSNFESGGSILDATGLQPRSLAYDPDRQLLFVSCGFLHNRIMVFDVASITDGEPAIHVLGQEDFTSNETGAGPDKLNSPFDLAYDPVTQRLFVADSENNRVLVYDMAVIEDGEPAVHVLGQTNFNSNGPATTAFGMSAPKGLAFANNILTVGDTGNHRVLVFNVEHITDGEAAVNVLGQSNFTSGDFNPSLTRSLASIEGMYIDPNTGSLYAADSLLNRVACFGEEFDAIGDAIEGLPAGGGGGGGGGGCFIATAALAEGGSYKVTDTTGEYRITATRLAELDTLRRFRDRVLRRTLAGRAFIAMYYRYGPAVADAIRPYPALRWSVRNGLILPLAAGSRLFLFEGPRMRDIWGFALLLLYGFGLLRLSRPVLRRFRVRR